MARAPRHRRPREVGTPGWSPIDTPLNDRGYNSAELTHWVVDRADTPADEAQFVNVFSVLVLRQAAHIDEATWDFARTPETIPGTRHKLVCGKSVMSMDDVRRLLALDHQSSTMIVPAIEKRYGRKPVFCPGGWIRPRILGQYDDPDRRLLPNLPGTVWMAELDPNPPHLPRIVGDAGADWLIQQLNERLGVNLSYEPDRLGAFLVAWPDDRLDINGARARSGLRVGLRLLATRLDLNQVSLTVVGKRAGCITCAATVERPRPWQVVDLNSDFDEFEVLAFDQVGTLLFAESMRPLRTIEFSGAAIDAEVSVRVQPIAPNGEPVGSAHAVVVRSGIPMDTRVSDVAPWEGRRRRARRAFAQAELVKQGRLRVFKGSSHERVEAIQHLRALVAAHHKGPLRIWDEYFGGEELLGLLGSLSHSRIPIRILTRQSPGPGDAATRPSIDDVLRGLQAVPDTAAAAYDIQHRDGPNFHDRFLITDRTCWQLGSSFNSIGASFSTIVEFPDSDLIRDEFDRRWAAWTPAAPMPKAKT